MMTDDTRPVFPRKILYVAMVMLLVAIFVGALGGAPPIYLAVGFIAEIILIATAHLSSVIQQSGRQRF